ncbi:MAG: SgcJ/EcaC family oxidoreductase [Verrucomicrobia bacterium]|nr:SgcJ/EcaC family oxidoreductase [Verrucomicrobiota bacterium]
MKRKSFLQLTVAGITLGLLSIASTTAGAQTANRDISGVIKAYEKALNAGDTTAVMALYGNDPVFTPPNSKGLAGRDAVKAGYEGTFKAIKPSLVFTIHEIVELGDTAYVRTSSEGEVEILANNAKVKDAYNELFIVRKEQGQWKIHRYIFNSAMPTAGK